MNQPNSPDQNLRAAQMIRSGEGQSEAIDRGNGIWESRGVGNSYLVTTGDGDVLVNAGTLADARRSRGLFAKVSSQPIRKIVLTQSHANQYGGLEIFKTSSNEVLAHRLYPEERRWNEALSEHYRRGSRRIFGGITGRTEDMVPTAEVSPDVLLGDEGTQFTLGGRRFEVIWTPGGETRSAVIVWLPQERVAIVGNLFGPLFANHPNLNTLRGDKPRSAMEFVASIRKLRDLRPVQILTGHEDIRGEEHIRKEVGRIADAVQWVHDRTLEGMNQGKDLRSLMREIRTPPELTLTEEYGKLSWNVRAIWHEYTGWFDPARGTTELYDVPPESIGPALAELAGGAARLAERAQAFLKTGQPLEALHLVDMALAAEPDCLPAKQAKRDALILLDHQTGGRNLWERRWIAAQIRDLGLADA
ncbi:alkyl sulfatase dimerization domain-containing protein [Novosphingobium sp. TH158]|uniref:alkyl sulfatase dimerization domain-containing protein n=1 Tax=Novosphingobium sp. TH158 TaxID=2067455 RepID=UPI000C7E817F|nr:alkyl sulfatase dimerization domain-containing protein [Novosphingobium sp. TH158]PLK26627.1 MBL fold metallo-hydrolase [Novosphingobium sp. TH158]